MKERLHRFFVRNDAGYETWVQQCHAKTLAGNFSGQHRLGSDHRSRAQVKNLMISPLCGGSQIP